MRHGLVNELPVSRAIFQCIHVLFGALGTVRYYHAPCIVIVDHGGHDFCQGACACSELDGGGCSSDARDEECCLDHLGRGSRMVWLFLL